MPQLPEKIEKSELLTAPVFSECLVLAKKLNEIIDYLGELEGGNKNDRS